MNWIAWFSASALVTSLGWTLLHFVWQGFVIALGLRVALRVLARERAEARYFAAAVALALCAVVPVVTFTMLHGGAAPVPVTAEFGTPERPAVPAGDALAVASDVAVGDRVAREGVAASSATVAYGWRAQVMASLTRALPMLVLGWLVGVLVISLRSAVGGYYVQALRREHIEPVGEALRERFETLKQRLGVDRSVVLLRSGLATVPCVVGYLKPVVLLPASAIYGLSAEQLETILAHELAHVKRYDNLMSLAQVAVEALVFFHPAVWWISDHVRAEREHCCDDLAVATSGSLHDYVQALASLEEQRRAASYATPSAFALAATDGSLLTRVRRLLDASKHAQDVQPASWAAGMFALVAVTALLLLGTPLAQPSSAALSETQPAALLVSEGAERPAAPGEAEPVASAAATVSTTPRDAADDEVARALIAALPDADASMRAQIAHTLGQREATEAVEALSGLLPDESASVRSRAAWALGMIEDARAVEPLGKRLGAEPDADVRNRIAWSLGMIEDARAVPTLTSALADEPNEAVRSRVVWALGMIEDENAVGPLLPLLADADADVRNRVAWSLGMIESRAATQALAQRLRVEADADVRDRIAWALGMIEDARAIPALTRVLTGELSGGVRDRIVWALGTIEDAEAVPALIPLLTDADAEIRERTAWALGMIESATATEALVQRFSAEPSGEVKSRIAWALGMIEDPRATGVLAEAIRSDDPDVRRAALVALGRLD